MNWRKDYHPNLDGPAEPVGLTMDQQPASAIAAEFRAALLTNNEPKWRKALRSLITLKLRELGPMNNNQIADACRLPVTDIAPRMSELVAELKIRDTGRRHSSVSGRGRKLVVWEAIQ